MVNDNNDNELRSQTEMNLPSYHCSRMSDRALALCFGRGKTLADCRSLSWTPGLASTLTNIRITITINIDNNNVKIIFTSHSTKCTVLGLYPYSWGPCQSEIGNSLKLWMDWFSSSCSRIILVFTFQSSSSCGLLKWALQALESELNNWQ